MNSLKSSFKYILFVFIFMFLFMPSVKADTKYTICDYQWGEDKLRLYYKDGVLFYGAYKIDDKWKYNEKEIFTAWKPSIASGYYSYTIKNGVVLSPMGLKKKIVSSSDFTETTFNSTIKNLSGSNCSILYVADFENVENGALEITLTEGDMIELEPHKEVYDIKDLTCNYEMKTDDSKTIIYNLEGDYNGLVEEKQSGAPKFGNASIFGHANAKQKWVSGFRTTNSFIDGIPDPSSGYDSSKNYSQQTYMYQYLKSVSKGGCFKSVITDSYRYYATFASPLDKTDVSNIVSDAFDESGFKIYELYCNTNYKDKINLIYNKEENTGSLVTAIELLPKIDDKSGWENSKKTCDDARNCACQGKSDISKYATCKIQNIQQEKYESIKTYKEYAYKEGCQENYDEAIKNINSDIANYINNLLDELVKNGIIIDEDANEARKRLSELENELEKFYNVNFTVGFNNGKIECDQLFGETCEKNDASVQCLITKLVDIARVLLPIILILLGSIDFAKVVISNEKEAMPKALSNFITRVIIAIAIFLLPTIINFLITILDNAMTLEEKMHCIIENL